MFQEATARRFVPSSRIFQPCRSGKSDTRRDNRVFKATRREFSHRVGHLAPHAHRIAPSSSIRRVRFQFRPVRISPGDRVRDEDRKGDLDQEQEEEDEEEIVDEDYEAPLEDDDFISDDDDSEEQVLADEALSPKEQDARSLAIRRAIERRQEQKKLDEDLNYLDLDLDT